MLLPIWIYFVVNSLLGFSLAILLLLEREGHINLYFNDKQKKLFDLFICPRNTLGLDEGEGIAPVVHSMEPLSYVALMTCIGILPKIIWSVYYIVVYLVMPMVVDAVVQFIWDALTWCKARGLL